MYVCMGEWMLGTVMSTQLFQCLVIFFSPLWKIIGFTLCPVVFLSRHSGVFPEAPAAAAADGGFETYLPGATCGVSALSSPKFTPPIKCRSGDTCLPIATPSSHGEVS